MPGFLGIERISQGPWQALERAIQRLLVHAGFDDVRLVGGSGGRWRRCSGKLGTTDLGYPVQVQVP